MYLKRDALVVAGAAAGGHPHNRAAAALVVIDLHVAQLARRRRLVLKEADARGGVNEPLSGTTLMRERHRLARPQGSWAVGQSMLQMAPKSVGSDCFGTLTHGPSELVQPGICEPSMA